MTTVNTELRGRESVGHGITGLLLQRAAAEGALQPSGPRVLLEAIWEEHARKFDSELARSVRLQIQDAIAFRIIAISPEVIERGFRVGDIVINVSISGERVDSKDDTSPYLIVHHEDIAAVIPAESLHGMLLPSL
jgi:co-chaperonin GroES (HSP10)